jgi:hypothetical protein
MVARHPSKREFVNTLIVGSKQLTLNLEEVKSAETPSERSLSESDFAATFKAFFKEVQPYIGTIGGLETHELEGHELEGHELEGHEPERDTSQRNAKRRYKSGRHTSGMSQCYPAKGMSPARFQKSGGCWSIEKRVRICVFMPASTA